MKTSNKSKSIAYDCGGPVNALANYWLTKIMYADCGETVAIPEFNLAAGASATMLEYLEQRQISPDCAFDLALEIAGIVTRSPFDAEAAIRAAIARAL